MSLKAKTEKQLSHVVSLLSEHTCVIEESESGLYIDDYITFDEMAAIVDYLRTKDTMDELFETCWKAYRRKGLKKKALEYWKKLTDVEKENVLPHIKAYVATRDLQFQKDFERYLRDKVFATVVFSNNNVAYDPTKLGKGESASNVYTPSGNFSITWDDTLHAYIYIGYYSHGCGIADGYTDDNRPDGARIVLNNGRGTIEWSASEKVWIRK